MKITEKARSILKYGYVCNHCLGRQFGKLISGTDNIQRGKALRMAVAMELDSENSLDGIAPENFYGISFHCEKLSGIKIKSTGKCSICGGFFSEIDKWVSRAMQSSEGMEFKTFLVGTSVSAGLLEKEESIWENIGTDGCEPLKAEINREMGKILEKVMKARADFKNPDINIILNITKNSVSVQSNPIFFYGEYQKLARGIPQTKWPSGKFKTSIEQIIAKPFMKIMGGSEHKLHGLGREDIDARCLGWRPFVIEILSPHSRSVDIADAMKIINKSKKIKVRKMKPSCIAEVRELKDSRARKEYRVDVICDRDINKKDIAKLKTLVGEIKQQTPTRVMRRRADLLRKRNVLKISAKLSGKRSFKLTVLGDAGLYIKELVSSDSGRTQPSVSSVLGCKCEPRNLDVMKIMV